MRRCGCHDTGRIHHRTGLCIVLVVVSDRGSGCTKRRTLYCTSHALAVLMVAAHRISTGWETAVPSGLAEVGLNCLQNIVEDVSATAALGSAPGNGLSCVESNRISGPRCLPLVGSKQ